MEKDDPYNGLISLPTEILRLILSFSPDVETLLSAILSCRTLYSAFIPSPSRLIAAVFQKHIDYDSDEFPELIQRLKAKVMFQSKPSRQDTPEMISQLFQQEVNIQEYPWTLPEALEAVQLDKVVKTLAITVSDAYLTSWALLTPENQQLHQQHQQPASSSELVRIQRSIYRFEVYRLCIPPTESKGVYDTTAVRNAFFNHYQPWELEQLSSVYESLWRLIAPAFNDVALHDIYWGFCGITYAIDFNDIHIASLLSLGIVHAYKCICATSYDERYNYVKDMPFSIKSFYVDILYDYNKPMSTAYWRDEPPPLPTDPSSTAASDSSPAIKALWRWALGEYAQTTLSSLDQHVSLRACGYVFWDQHRIEKSKLLDYEWEDLEFEVTESVVDNEPDVEVQRQSITNREILFYRGEEGYWDNSTDMDEYLRQKYPSSRPKTPPSQWKAYNPIKETIPQQ